MSQTNPIIGSTPAETLQDAAYVASFLVRLQLDRSEGLFREEASDTAWPGELTANETRGLYFVTSALAAALWFEVETRPNEERRRGDLRRGRHDHGDGDQARAMTARERGRGIRWRTKSY